jgi:hypothetical protein
MQMEQTAGTRLISLERGFVGTPWTFTPEGKGFGMTMEHLGLIPMFLNEMDKRPAREQFEENYAHGGGWRKTSPKWAMDPVSHAITYGVADEEGPAERYVPLAETKLRDERIFFYDSSWVSIVQPDGSFEVSRVD